MEKQYNDSTKTPVTKKGFFTKISTVEEAQKPIKSISTLFYVIGGISVLGGTVAVVSPYSQKVSTGLLILVGIVSIISGVVFIVGANQLKKNKDNTAAWTIFCLSVLWLIGAIINLKILAILLGLLAFFSSIDAIMILKQLDKLSSE